MFGQEFTKNFGFVMVPPQELNDAAVDSEWISLADYGHATVFVMVGDTAAASFALTINEATDTSGTGGQALTWTKLKSTGQKLVISTISGTFSIGETITGSSSGLTGELFEIGRDYMIIRCLTGGTTWTTGETLSGTTSSATAVLTGTGQDEDMLVDKYAAVSSTHTIPAVTFKVYAIEIDADTLSTGYDYIQVAMADPGGSVLAGACVVLSNPRHRGNPMPSAIGTQKYCATSA